MRIIEFHCDGCGAVGREYWRGSATPLPSRWRCTSVTVNSGLHDYGPYYLKDDSILEADLCPRCIVRLQIGMNATRWDKAKVKAEYDAEDAAKINEED